MMNMGLLKAALYRPQGLDSDIPVLPESTIRKELQINTLHCERYNKAVNWKLGIASVIHPNYLQVLTLPMQLEMMISEPFPFKPMGLVHLANHIEFNYLPEQNAKMLLQTSFNGLTWHKNGWVFALLSEGFVNGKLAISATSYYLSRQRHSQVNKNPNVTKDVVFDTVNFDAATSKTTAAPKFAAEMPTIDELLPPFDGSVDMHFPLGIGRQYARVSGDFNPIHLSRWTAKLMGFKQAIAHGMYSKALCLSVILKQEMQSRKGALAQTPMQVSTQFIQPIYLPTRCELNIKREGDSLGFSLSSKNRSKTREHLRTTVVIA